MSWELDKIGARDSGARDSGYGNRVRGIGIYSCFATKATGVIDQTTKLRANT